MSNIILPRSTELDRLVGEAFTSLRATLSFDRLAFCRASAENEVEITAVQQEDGLSHTPPGTRIPYADVLGADVVMSGLAIVIEPHKSPLPFDQKVAAAGIRHVLRVPVGREGAAAGAITVSRREGQFTQAEIDGVGKIAEGISTEVLALVVDAEAEARENALD